MALVERDIAGGNNDYASLTEFVADLANAAFTANDVVAYIYANQSLTGTTTISNTNPASITLAPATGSEHDGTRDGSGITITGTAGSNPSISITRTNVTIRDLRFVLNGSGNYHNLGLRCSASGVAFRRNAIFGSGAGHLNSEPRGIDSTGGDCEIVNNIVANIRNPTTGNGIGIRAPYDAKKIINNTVYNCYTGIFGIANASQVFANNISVGNTTADYSVSGSGDTRTNNMYTNGGTSFGTSPIEAPSDLATLFADTTTATLDLHLLNGSTGADAAGVDGTSYATDANIDIDRVERSGSWDLGADQYVASGPSPATADITQTLTSLSQASAVSTEKTTTVAQSLSAITQASVTQDTVTGTITEILPFPTVVASGTVEQFVTATSVLPTITQAVAAAQDASPVTVTQTLAAVSQSFDLVIELPRNVDTTQSLSPITQTSAVTTPAATMTVASQIAAATQAVEAALSLPTVAAAQSIATITQAAVWTTDNAATMDLAATIRAATQTVYITPFITPTPPGRKSKVVRTPRSVAAR